MENKENDLKEDIKEENGEVMTDRKRTKSGRYRKKRSDAGKKRKKKKSFWDKFFE